MDLSTGDITELNFAAEILMQGFNRKNVGFSQRSKTHTHRLSKV